MDGYLAAHLTYPVAAAARLNSVTVDFSTFAEGRPRAIFRHAWLTFERARQQASWSRMRTSGGGAKSIRLLPLVSLFIRFPEPVGQLVLPILASTSLIGIGPRLMVVRGALADGATVLQTIDLGGGADPPNLRLDVALDERFDPVTSLELRGLRGVYLLGLSYVTAAQLDALDALAEDRRRLLEERPLLLPEPITA